MVTDAPEFTVKDFIVVLAATAGIRTVPELMTTSVVAIGTIPVLQFAARDQTVLVPPSQVVCDFPAKRESCITAYKINTLRKTLGPVAIFTIFMLLFGV
jgi:hypothetical protein